MPFGPMMAPSFEHMATMPPLAGPLMPGAFQTVSDAQMTAASSRGGFDDTERKNKAKIELLEKKIRAKD